MPIFRRTEPMKVRASADLTLQNEHGLHARPATEFVRVASQFKSTLTIKAKGRRFRADRIMEILLADLNCGDAFVLEAEGADADQAVERLSKIIHQLKDAEDKARFARNPHTATLD